VVFSDVGRVKELEREKRRAERLAAFGAFASGIAHEIKNPLVAIRTFAELLPERFADEEFRQDFSGVVLKEIERIDQLVARLRGLAVPSSSPFSVLDIRQPIEEVLTLLRGQLLQKDVSALREYNATHVHILGDLDQLKQLFLNLFINAIEAMDRCGQLRIILANQVGRAGHSISVEVVDTGPGIPEPLLSRMFEPFVTTKPNGSGLGLAICRGIMDAHKATIRAKNAGGASGARITLEFPIADAAQEVVAH
jgi:signal transduction histidine kinase